MSDTPTTAWPAEGRQHGREAFRQAVRATVAHAATLGVPQMFWCDPDFADWPLTEPGVVASLHTWALGGGRLRMLASDFRGVQAHCARFVHWRRQWDHRFEARSCGKARASELPSVLLAGDHALLRLDAQQGVFVVTTERARRAQTEQTLDSWWQAAVSAFPASTLGL